MNLGLVLSLWVLAGAVTTLLVLWVKKPASDAPILWPLVLLAIGPIGLVYFFVLAVRSFRKGIRESL